MKQILLLLLVIGFTSLSAQATTQVFYGNTGIPSNATYGATYNKSINNFGENAAFKPENVRRREAIVRAQKHEDQYYNGLEKGQNQNFHRYKNRPVIITTTPKQETTSIETPVTENVETPVNNTTTLEEVKPTVKELKKKTVTKNGVTYYN